MSLGQKPRRTVNRGFDLTNTLHSITHSFTFHLRVLLYGIQHEQDKAFGSMHFFCVLTEVATSLFGMVWGRAKWTMTDIFCLPSGVASHSCYYNYYVPPCTHIHKKGNDNNKSKQNKHPPPPSLPPPRLDVFCWRFHVLLCFTFCRCILYEIQ